MKRKPESQSSPARAADNELAAIKESVSRASGRIFLERSLLREFYLMRAREKRSPKMQERMLLSLRGTKRQNRDLRIEPIKSTILNALEANDTRFFIKLGRVLGTAAFDESYQGKQPSRLQVFLLHHWATASDGLPELYRLNRESLAAVCAKELGNDNLTADAVGKVRQRLGLKTTRGRKLQAFIQGKRFRFQ